MIRRRLRGNCPVVKPLLFILCALSLPHGVGAQAGAWQPSPGHTQIPIWPGAVPDARTDHGTEVSGMVVDASGRAKPVGGRPWVYVDSVSQPTMTVYSPAGANTGVAVVVFPGGGYNVLAIDLEGTEACDWLTSKGITCVLLKYRVPCAKTGPYRDCLTALQDAQRTVGLVRFAGRSLARRSAQDRRPRLFGRRAHGRGDEHALREAPVPDGGRG